jgi:peptidoglycan/LPS O-acetylase OafA/YrhL
MKPSRIARRSAPPLTYDEYRSTRYFRALDGLRAVSILLVVIFHSNSALWTSLQGWLGVGIFFVLSGYLITTLCLREEEDAGRLSLAGFYIRRTCRIFPLYFLVLGAYAALYLGLDYGHHRADLAAVLPHYLTYFNDLAPIRPETPFPQSWSLGVEEKFYLLWPLLAFVLLRARPRRRLLGALGLALLPVALWPFRSFAWYVPYSNIMVGCLLALCLHHRTGFRRLRVFASGLWLWLAIGALLCAHLAAVRFPSQLEYVYPFFVAIVVVGVLLGDAPWVRLLRTRALVFVGTRAYGVYLVHLACLLAWIAVLRHVGVSFDAAGRPAGEGRLAATLVLFALGTVSSLIVAHLLYRIVERPFIALGRRRSARLTVPRRPAPVRLRRQEEPAELAA